MIDHHIIFYTSMAVAMIALVIANIIVMRYFLTQMRLFKEAQDKLLEAFRLMEQAHQVTFDVLKATESFLKFVADEWKTQQDAHDAMYARISLLEEKVKDLTDALKHTDSQPAQSDDGR